MNRELESAFEFQRMGYHPIPLAPHSKIPQQGFSLAEHFKRDVRVEEIPQWFADNANLALGTGRLIGLDFDDKQQAREFYKRHKGTLKTINETRNGVHFLFQSPCPDLPTGKFEHGDLKATGGYIVIPHSTVSDKKYPTPWTYRFVQGHELVSFDELPMFEPDMVKMTPKAVEGKAATTREEVRHAIAYVMTVESIQGSHGSHGLVRACSILRDSGMSEAEATVVMIDWNNSGKAVPPWPIREVTRAISRAYAKGKK